MLSSGWRAGSDLRGSQRQIGPASPLQVAHCPSSNHSSRAVDALGDELPLEVSSAVRPFGAAPVFEAESNRGSSFEMQPTFAVFPEQGGLENGLVHFEPAIAKELAVVDPDRVLCDRAGRRTGRVAAPSNRHADPHFARARIRRRVRCQRFAAVDGFHDAFVVKRVVQTVELVSPIVQLPSVKRPLARPSRPVALYLGTSLEFEGDAKETPDSPTGGRTALQCRGTLDTSKRRCTACHSLAHSSR